MPATGTLYRSAIKLTRDRSLFPGEQRDAPQKIGTGCMWVDPNPAAPAVHFKIKDSNGAIRTATITLM